VWSDFHGFGVNKVQDYFVAFFALEGLFSLKIQPLVIDITLIKMKKRFESISNFTIL